MQARKADGYTVVGVEQTSSSVSLPDFGFVQRTVLVLGNEMTGTIHILQRSPTGAMASGSHVREEQN